MTTFDHRITFSLGAVDPRSPRLIRWFPTRGNLMTRRSIHWLIALALAAGAPAVRAQLVCDEWYPGNPAPGSQAWRDRDANNVACGHQRQTDADASPAFQ